MAPLDLWFPEDVERILRSLTSAALRHPDEAYRRAYLAALEDVAQTFGIGPRMEHITEWTPISDHTS